MAALSHFLIMVFVYFRRFSALQLNNASGYKALQKKGWARTRAGGGEVPLLVLHCAEDQIVPVALRVGTASLQRAPVAGAEGGTRERAPKIESVAVAKDPHCAIGQEPR